MNGFSRNPEIILPITPTPGRRAERFNFSRKSFSGDVQFTRRRCSSPHARFSGIISILSNNFSDATGVELSEYSNTAAAVNESKPSFPAEFQ
jgi:hypothetical protein